VSCAKTAEPIDLPFGLWTRVGQKKYKFNRIRQVGAIVPSSNDEYDWTVRLRRRWGLMSNYFDHLLLCWNSVYRQLFGFHKWELVKYCIYGLNRLDLHSIITLRRASFYRHIMLSASRLVCNIFLCFSLILRLTTTFDLYLGCI